MIKERKNNWRLRLQTVSCGLLIVAAFAPLSETLHKILAAVAVAGMLVYLATDSPAARKESARFLVLVVASILLALLLSVNPVWMALAALVGTILWELDRQEKAEDPGDRKPRVDL